LQWRPRERTGFGIVFDPEEFDSALDDLEVRLERLNLRYERFFSGSERTEPAALREEIDHQLAQLLVEQKHLGALARVRLTLVHQRYDGYQQCWKRLASRASSGAHSRQLAARESTPPIERATRVLREPVLRSDAPPASHSSQHLVTPVTGLDGSFARSSRPAPARALTPPLGTPSTSPLQPQPIVASNESAPRAARPESSRTIRDFRQPLAREGARTIPDLRPSFETASREHEAKKTDPGLPHFARNADSSSVTPRTNPVSDASPRVNARIPSPPVNPRIATPLINARVPTPPLPPPQLTAAEPGEPAAPATRAVSMERVQEIHARLRASNGRPPSLERLAKRLSETEAKLKALHGDRTVTFDVILRDGKAIVKPIVH
jgi:hypothetical protein